MPKANAEYWRAKLERNVQRDNEVAAILAAAGWSVLTLWECDIRADMLGSVDQVRNAVARS